MAEYTPPPPESHHRMVWLVTAVLVAVGALLLFEPFERKDDQPQELPPELVDEPDLEIEGAIITQYQSDGSRKYRLQADEIRHFEAGSRNGPVTHLTDPDLFLYGEPDPPWRVRSRLGTITRENRPEGGDEEVVHLERDVHMEQRHDSGRYLIVRSEAMVLYTDRQYAEGTQDVTIDTDTGRTSAVGFTGDLNRGLLDLFSNDDQRVHTIILPRQFK